ncbi:MAG TPA: spore coat U domain-containing protein [Gammaproteobacteria bacterium]
MNKANQVVVALALCGCLMIKISPAVACTVTATNFQFGTIDPLIATDHQSSSTVTVTCPGVTAYTVSLSPGGGTYGQRQMASGGNTLNYNLYISSLYTSIWGDGTGSTSTVSGNADSSGSVLTVYGRLPHQPTAIPGSYADSIVVTVTF